MKSLDMLITSLEEKKRLISTLSSTVNTSDSLQTCRAGSTDKVMEVQTGS
jgi:hypothetical protein